MPLDQRMQSVISGDFGKMQLRVDKKEWKCMARLVVVNRCIC